MIRSLDLPGGPGDCTGEITLASGEPPIRSLLRGLALLEEINARRCATLTHLSEHAGLPKPTALRILRTLEHAGLIVRRGRNKAYFPTSRVLSLSAGFDAGGLLVECARETIVELTRDLGWPVTLLTRSGARMTIEDTTDDLTSLTFDSYRIGTTIPIFGSAAGHCCFVHSDEEQRREMIRTAVLEDDRPARAAVRQLGNPALLARLKALGYTTVASLPSLHGDRRYGGIAAPVLVDDRPVGVVSMLYFATAMEPEQAAARYATRLIDAGRSIAAKLSAASRDKLAAASNKPP